MPCLLQNSLSDFNVFPLNFLIQTFLFPSKSNLVISSKKQTLIILLPWVSSAPVYSISTLFILHLLMYDLVINVSLYPSKHFAFLSDYKPIPAMVSYLQFSIYSIHLLSSRPFSHCSLCLALFY